MLVSFGFRMLAQSGLGRWSLSLWPQVPLRFWNMGGAWNDANAEAYESL